MKFKIGDKVRVLDFVNSLGSDDRSVIGHTGKIVSIDKFYEYPYQVEYDVIKSNTCLFCEEELELVEEEYEISNGIRDEVRWFAQEMEKKLQEKDDVFPNGWKNDKVKDLHYLLDWKSKEIEDFIFHYPNGYTDEKRIELCVDVANFAMMIADKIKKGDINV